MSKETQVAEIGDYAIVCGDAGDLVKFYGERVLIINGNDITFAGYPITSKLANGELLSLMIGEFYIV